MSQPIPSQSETDFSLKFAFMQMATSNWLSQSIYAAAKLGIADLLIDRAKNYEEIATATQCHPRSIYRLLRALASVGIFAETDIGYFTLTPLANYLQSDSPDSLRAMSVMNGEEQYRSWGDILYSLQTGNSTFENSYGMNVFKYFAQNPEQAKIFNQAMTSYSVVQNKGLILDYDFSGIKTLVDVGGGNGKLLSEVLRNHPEMKGILYDLPEVVASSQPLIAAAGLADRCQIIGGNFFEEVPAGGDAYILKFILHDWGSQKSIEILKRCREVIPANGKLLIAEYVIPPGNEPSFGKFLDMHMLIMCQGGCERTEEEYRFLLSQAGFELTKVVPTKSMMSVIESVPI
jgi:hypothetical protein